MSDTSRVHLSAAGPPETRLPEPSAEFRHRLKRALESPEPRSAVSEVVASDPRECLGWATLASITDESMARYAFHRVGYHRGLDALRANGWKGSGFVRWSHDGNLGFLRCLRGLMQDAASIGESDEHERCRLFLLQLDPGGIPTTS